MNLLWLLAVLHQHDKTKESMTDEEFEAYAKSMNIFMACCLILSILFLAGILYITFR